jgi:RimJ/RimL family protein N-acetyltransferase
MIIDKEKPNINLIMKLQPVHLKNEWVVLLPLQQSDFETLYEVAKDPLIWEQHPNPDRYKKEVFEIYFQGAIESGGAFLVKDLSGNVVGCTRFYGYIPDKRVINIGYTFFSRNSWGKPYNQSTKSLMLDYAFNYVDVVHFHIGAQNIRSQKAIEKTGAILIGEDTIAYYGEEPKANKIYKIEADTFRKK